IFCWSEFFHLRENLRVSTVCSLRPTPSDAAAYTNFSSYPKTLERRSHPSRADRTTAQRGTRRDNADIPARKFSNPPTQYLFAKNRCRSTFGAASIATKTT